MKAETKIQIEAISAQRTANRNSVGVIINQALDRRLQIEERRLVIAACGWTPEEPGNRYAAETGEMISWLNSGVTQ